MYFSLEPMQVKLLMSDFPATLRSTYPLQFTQPLAEFLVNPISSITNIPLVCQRYFTNRRR